MIAIQVLISILLFVGIEVFFPQPAVSIYERVFFLLQIIVIWSFLFTKFRLGIIFRAETFGNMTRGYLFTITMGALILLTEYLLIRLNGRYTYSIYYFITFSLVDLVVLISFKLGFYYTIRYLRKTGYNTRIVIIIADSSSIPFIDSFIAAKDWGYRIRSIISTDDNLVNKYENTQLINSQEGLKKYITVKTVDDIFYCLPVSDNHFNLEQLVEDTAEIGITLHIMQQDYINKRDSGFNHNFVTRSALKQSYLCLKAKSLFDFIFSILILILTLPFMCIIALIVKLEDGGPVFFKQERIGLNGRRFICYKFRSMVINAEDQIANLQDRNESDGPTFKIENDPRITKIGKFLRRTSLDELPQFYNVIKGEMSVVGPRPPLLSEVKQYERSQLRRLSMKPGITCKWQVWGRNQVSFKEWMKMDLDYIDNWSLWLDFKIIFATVVVVLKANGR